MHNIVNGLKKKSGFKLPLVSMFINAMPQFHTGKMP